jgi:hypothetical protein
MEEHRGEQKHPPPKNAAVSFTIFIAPAISSATPAIDVRIATTPEGPSDTYSLVHSLQFSCEKTSL